MGNDRSRAALIGTTVDWLLTGLVSAFSDKFQLDKTCSPEIIYAVLVNEAPAACWSFLCTCTPLVLYFGLKQVNQNHDKVMP